MISRILTRLAIVWLIGWGGVLLAIAIINGTLADVDWAAAGAIVLGPPVIALALAWVFAPR